MSTYIVTIPGGKKYKIKADTVYVMQNHDTLVLTSIISGQTINVASFKVWTSVYNEENYTNETPMQD